ncbi:MAG TPA: polymorphic toxin-type HINT domain-containing protein [Jiangellales bacterium]|nr:polymorphic toxin-type HINT domain-containing protein [Jiangellales bacterium]
MSWSDIGHAALDVVGMVPVVGEVADVANGIWYMAEGNYVDGALSLASAIPLAGNVVGAAKLAKTGKKIYDAADTSMDVARQADNLADASKAVPSTPDVPPVTKAGTPKTDTPTTKMPDCNSFIPGTRVLLADGSTKPIEDVKVGDEVAASDVESGDRQVRPVTALIPGDGVPKLYTITIDTDGKAGDQSGQIVATNNHRFWLPEAGTWATAKQLRPGMWLQIGSGTWVQITAVEHETKKQRVHNFTVEGVHTYYVFAGAASILVHNDACPVGNNKKFENWKKRNSEKGYTVYHGLDDQGNVVYAGITKNLKKREAQHIAKKYGIAELEPVPGAVNLTKWQARAIEQVLIERVRGTAFRRMKNNVPIEQNNSISPKRTGIYDKAVKWGQDWLNQ